MKNVGIAAIVLGILIFVLGRAGVIGQDGDIRTVTVGAIILLAVGFLLYSRGKSRLG